MLLIVMYLFINLSAKTASKSVHPFGWNFVHKKSQTDTQTNCSENIIGYIRLDLSIQDVSGQTVRRTDSVKGVTATK